MKAPNVVLKTPNVVLKVPNVVLGSIEYVVLSSISYYLQVVLGSIV